MDIVFKPVAYVKNTRTIPSDDHWASVISEIELAENIPTEALNNIAGFSHLEIIYFFDQVDPKKMVYAGHPRENLSYPMMGIFAQRKKDRPNPIGLCTVELIKHERRTLTVKYLDAIDGTSVLDIKPVFKEFQPKGEIKQPEWVYDLMKKYW